MTGEKKMWFAPKTYGYGGGLPIRWQGWAVLVLFFGGIFAVLRIARTYFTGAERTAMHFGGVALLVIALILIARGRTEGGWRWRSGDD